VEGPTRAKVTEPRFLHICANLYTHAHTHTHIRKLQCLTFAAVDSTSVILRVCVCVALFASLYPAIHRRVRCTRPKERHGHSENRRAGQAKKKSYPEWREDGYSARKLEIDGGSENERHCEVQGGRRDLSRSDVEDRTCSPGSSCSTILEREGREREKERRRADSASSSSLVRDRGGRNVYSARDRNSTMRRIICSVVIAIHRSFSDLRGGRRGPESARVS